MRDPLELVRIARSITSHNGWSVPPLTRANPVKIGCYTGIRSYFHWEAQQDGSWFAWETSVEREEGTAPHVFDGIVPDSFPYAISPSGLSLYVVEH
jgi:hypothetical protein